jgi:hypothetical protein
MATKDEAISAVVSIGCRSLATIPLLASTVLLYNANAAHALAKRVANKV